MDACCPDQVLAPEDVDELAARLLGQTRTKLGGLHIAHARRVAAAVRRRGNPDAFAAALLHDVVETSRISLEDLRAETANDRVVALVDILTRRPDETERSYLSRCASDPDALVVKRADLADKVLCDDFTVAPSVAEAFQRQAIERLALLDTVSGYHPVSGDGDCSPAVLSCRAHTETGDDHGQRR